MVLLLYLEIFSRVQGHKDFSQYEHFSSIQRLILLQIHTCLLLVILRSVTLYTLFVLPFKWCNCLLMSTNIANSKMQLLLFKIFYSVYLPCGVFEKLSMCILYKTYFYDEDAVIYHLYVIIFITSNYVTQYDSSIYYKMMKSG